MYNVNNFSILKDDFGIKTKQSFTNNMKTEEISRTITKNNIFGPRIENIDIEKIKIYLVHRDKIIIQIFLIKY